MSNISQVRGALLEEAILYLLEKVGYETLTDSSSFNNQELRGGHSGLEVRGRGSWHQIDALALFPASPAFMYPLRLMVEAKCYRENRPVGIDVARNSVGVLKDISENYFTVQRRTGQYLQVPSFNYHSAIFSTSGYTAGAVEYALAHQIFLIQYNNVSVIRPLIRAIMQFGPECLTNLGKQSVKEVRERYRNAISGNYYEMDMRNYLTEEGINLIDNALVETLQQIQGSYFGMLQGRWPLHLLTHRELPPHAFETDVVQCRVVGYQTGNWKFTPLHFQPGEPGWFELEFDLPEQIASLVAREWDSREAVANIKRQHFSFIQLSGIIGGIRRSVKLELNNEWIEEYIHSLQPRI